MTARRGVVTLPTTLTHQRQHLVDAHAGDRHRRHGNLRTLIAAVATVEVG